MIREARLVNSQDIQMVARAILEEQNRAGNRLVGVDVEKKYNDYYEIQMTFYSTNVKTMSQRIVINLVERGKVFLYADSIKDVYTEDGYNLTILEISSTKIDSVRDFVLMVFEK